MSDNCNNQGPVDTQEKLKLLHRALLHLHKTLLDSEREAYERVNGSTTSARMLQLVIGDPFFDWLHGISRLIVSIDETMDTKNSAARGEDVNKLLKRARNLLITPETGSQFEKKYSAALKREPAARLKHDEIASLIAES